MMKYLITLLVLLTTLTGIMAQDNETGETIIHIGPYQQDCVGVGPQDCLIVRFEDEDRAFYFYDSIEGFTFEQGFEYTLSVNVSQLDDVPADASSLQYELLEIIQQFPAHLHGKVWELQTLDGEEIENPSRYTFTTTDEGTGMTADCNQVIANLSLNPFLIETTISTMAFCGDDSLDVTYLAALNSASMMTIENGQLIMETEEGQLRFAPPSIEGIEWTMTRYLSPASMLLLNDTTPYTLQIGDEQASMTIACNGAGASLEFDGAILTFGEIEAEEELCENDPLSGIFPPETAVYYVSDTGNLILEDSSGGLFEFASGEA